MENCCGSGAWRELVKLPSHVCASDIFYIFCHPWDVWYSLHLFYPHFFTISPHLFVFSLHPLPAQTVFAQENTLACNDRGWLLFFCPKKRGRRLGFPAGKVLNCLLTCCLVADCSWGAELWQKSVFKMHIQCMYWMWPNVGRSGCLHRELLIFLQNLKKKSLQYTVTDSFSAYNSI